MSFFFFGSLILRALDVVMHSIRAFMFCVKIPLVPLVLGQQTSRMCIAQGDIPIPRKEERTECLSLCCAMLC